MQSYPLVSILYNEKHKMVLFYSKNFITGEQVNKMYVTTRALFFQPDNVMNFETWNKNNY